MLRALTPADFTIAGEREDALTMRRPKPLIPLNTAPERVSSNRRTSFPTTPADLTLTNIANVRKGAKITNISADASFLVVFVLITSNQLDGFVRCMFASRHDPFYKAYAIELNCEDLDVYWVFLDRLVARS